jgi:predicted dehydrogenase
VVVVSDEAQGGGVLGARLARGRLDPFLPGEIAEVRGSLQTCIKVEPALEQFREKSALFRSDDYAAAWMRLEQGGEVNLTLSAVTREDPWAKIGLHGEKGSLVLDEHQRLWKRAHGEAAYTEALVEDSPLPPLGSKVPDSPCARAFLLFAHAIREAILRNQATVPGAATFEDGLRNQLVLDAVRESSKRGDWVAVDAAAARA